MCLRARLYGGGQEEGLRSGTENTPGILGMGEAVRAYPQGAPAEMMANKRLLWTLIQQRIPGACLNGPAMDDPACAPHILNVSFPPVRSQTMLFALEGDGIYVSSGSACASRKQKLSGVLTAMGLPTDRIDSALRFSLCPGLTAEQMTYTADRLEMCIRDSFSTASIACAFRRPAATATIWHVGDRCTRSTPTLRCV